MTTTIRLVLENGEVILGELDETVMAKDFVKRLPMEVALEDYHGIEKIFYLSEKLDTTNAPDGYDPSVGDITYYAPWGNVAIFVRDFGFAAGLVPLGRITENFAALQKAGAIKLRIEEAE